MGKAWPLGHYGLEVQDVFDIGGKLCCRLIAVFGSFLKCMEQNRVEVIGQTRTVLLRRDRLFEDNLGECLVYCVGLERRLQGQAFVVRGRQGIDIASAIDLLRAADLLGRSIARRSKELACDCQFRLGLESGQSEVNELGCSVRVYQDVGGLYVAVEDASLVGIFEHEATLTIILLTLMM